MKNLLPRDALAQVRIGISASSSPDLGRLGLFEDHFRLALGELARMVLLLGGKLQYCGHLESAGYTVSLVNELKRYGRRNDPLSVVLAWSVHRQLKLKDLRRMREDLGLLGRITCLDAEGQVVEWSDGRSEEPAPVADEEIACGLTAMRRTAVRETQGRFFIGGRRSGYRGLMPGLLEEVALALDAGQPVFLAGGFGGVAHDIVRCIDPLAAAWLPPGESELRDDGWRGGLQTVAKLIGTTAWGALRNGLMTSENVQLAATPRASEIATLVSTGLGRLAQGGKLAKQGSTT